MTPLPAIGHLAMERESHTVDLPPASPSCQCGRTDLTDLSRVRTTNRIQCEFADPVSIHFNHVRTIVLQCEFDTT